MYFEAGPSKKPLLAEDSFAFSDMARLYIDSKSSHVESMGTDAEAEISISSTRAFKHRPLNLTDNFEIIGGVPTFVFLSPENYEPNSRLFAFSSDGTRMALRVGWRNINVYDVSDNFSLIAEGKNLGRSKITQVSFWDDQANEIVVVFDDSQIIVYSILVNTDFVYSQSKKDIKPAGTLGVVRDHKLFERSERAKDIGLKLVTIGPKVMVCGWEHSALDILHVCMLAQGEEFLRFKNKGSCTTEPTYAYASIVQRALMLVHLHPNTHKLNKTRILQDRDFNYEYMKETSAEVPGRGFGWSLDESYFLTWKVKESGESKLELYTSEAVILNRGATPPTTSRSLGASVLWVLATFVNRKSASPTSMTESWHHPLPLISVVVARSSGIKHIFWDLAENDIIDEMELNVKEMDMSSDSQIDYCISPNMKWIAIGCWESKQIALFSVTSKSLIWTVSLEMHPTPCSIFNGMRFDITCTKLIVDCNKTLYVFVPPCLVEHYHLEFESKSYRLKHEADGSLASLKTKHQMLIPKHVLCHAFGLQLGIGIDNSTAIIVDVANSIITSQIAVLVYKEQSLDLHLGNYEDVCTSAFKEFLEDGSIEDQMSHGIRKIRITSEVAVSSSSQGTLPYHVFLYPNEQKNEDSIALFSLENGLRASFIDLKGSGMLKSLHFCEGEWFYIRQTNDASKVSCIGHQGVVIIDLNQQTIVRAVVYKENVTQWICSSLKTRKSDFFTVLEDGASILVGWNAKTENCLIVRPTMSNKEFEDLQKYIHEAVPCWPLSYDNKKIVYLEFDKSDLTISGIGCLNLRNKKIKRVKKNEWNKHIVRATRKIAKTNMMEYSLQLDEKNGFLWLVAVQQAKVDEHRLLWVPFGPHSMKSCITCLFMRDFLARDIREDEIEELIQKDGFSTFNMTFNKKTNFQIALTYKNGAVMRSLFDSAIEYGIPMEKIWNDKQIHDRVSKLLETAIKEKNEAMVKFFLHLVEKQLLDFNDSAEMMEVCFEDLWIYYRSLLEPMITADILGWNVCDIEVFSDIFNVEAHFGGQIGTCDNIEEWNEDAMDGRASEHWKSLNKKYVDEIMRQGSPATVKATVKVFCIDNVCKIGLNGIVRFLLMQNAASFVFKTSLVKSIITWKWENVWKGRSLINLIIYSIFVAGFTTYSIWVAYLGKEMAKDFLTYIFLSCWLLCLMFISFYLCLQEHTQLKTYTKDGEQLFPDDHSWGLRYYLSSRWNLVETSTNLLLLIAIPVLHGLIRYNTSFLPYLYGCLALGTILIWIKVWYFAQANKKTGPLVLILENVIADCVPFLFLALVVLLEFSFALFVLFQYTLDNLDEDSSTTGVSESSNRDSGESQGASDNQDSDDSREMIQSCFGSPQKAMATMFYAMIGAFEVELYQIESDLKPLIIVLFVAYLALQLILMLNMLIALMSDTFDRVKSTEEEQLLLGRARFIDACEATLGRKQIGDIDGDVKKYLYILTPLKEASDRDAVAWQGRVKTIEESVKSMINQSQQAMFRKLDKDIRNLNEKMTKQEENIVEFREKVDEDLSHLREKMDEDVYGLKLKMDNDMGMLKGKMDSDMGTLKEKMDDDMGTLKGKMDGDMGGLKGKMDDDMGGLKTKMDTDMGLLNQSIDEHVNILTEKMDGDMEDLRTKMDEDITHLNTKIDEDITNLRQKIDDDVRNLDEKLIIQQTNIEEFKHMMNEDIGHLKSQINDDIGGVKEAMQENIGSLDIKMVSQHENIESFRKKIDDDLSGLREKFDGDMSGLDVKMVNQDKNIGGFNENMSERVGGLVSKMETDSQTLQEIKHLLQSHLVATTSHTIGGSGGGDGGDGGGFTGERSGGEKEGSTGGTPGPGPKPQWR